MTSFDASLCMVVVAIRMSLSIIMIVVTTSRYLRTFNIRLVIRDTAIKLMAHVMAMVILLIARITIRVIILGARVMLGSQIIVPVANICLEDVLVELAVTMLIPMRLFYTTIHTSVALVAGMTKTTQRFPITKMYSRKV